jgi:hypothetical protein
VSRDDERWPRGRDQRSDDDHVSVIISADRDSRRDWRELWQREYRLALARAAERRARVLAHPDLAELLTVREVGYARPEQWTGYIPPATWNGEHNDSPRRATLTAIAAEAMRRGKVAIEA